jgi:Flp pilus assembly protein TadG
MFPRAKSRTRIRARHRTRQRGAILVEAAIIAPIALVLVFGTMELGYAYYGKLTIEHMSIAGARAASGGANDVYADFSTLKAVDDARTGMGSTSITKIVIYRATSPGDRVPTACKSGPVTNSTNTRGCNYYSGADFSLAQTAFGCGTSPPEKDRYWCPTTRKYALDATSSNGPPDYIGVYVEGVHKNLIGLFGKTFTFSNDTVIRIEPRTLR